MVEKVIKRDGRVVKFSPRRIRDAVSSAIKNTGLGTYGVVKDILSSCIDALNVKYGEKGIVTVEEVQDTIVMILNEMLLKNVADAFVDYRQERDKIRETKSDVMKAIDKIGKETTRDNANVGNNFSAKLLQIASVANKWHNLASMDKKFSKAHENGDIHIHDLDSFNLTLNCLLIDLDKLFKTGFNTGYGTINSPKRVESAAELSCIILQSSQNDMFGGQGFTDFDNNFSSSIVKTREEIVKKFKAMWTEILGTEIKEEDKFKDAVEKELIDRVSQSMQAVVYNYNSMHSRAGSQVPFSSVNIGLPKTKEAAMACEYFLKEYNKGLGKNEQPIFPNIIFRVKKGVNAEPGDPYYYLFELAIKVAANRMNPTFLLLDAPQNIGWYNKGYIASRMGCRTNIMENLNGEQGPNGRGNNFPVTLNLPRVGLMSAGDWSKFYKILDKRMDLCFEELLDRYETCKNLKVKDLPFVAGQGLMKGSEGLSADDSIEPIMKNGTMGIGFIGLAETLIAMTGKHHGESKESLEKGLEIVEFMYKKTNDYKEKSHLNFSLYATPAEGLCGRFVVYDKSQFGIVKGVTDKDYYTNSNHIPVSYPISAMNKMDIEGLFHKYCTAGNIAYVEIDGGDTEDRARFIKKHLTYCINNTEASYISYNFSIRYCKNDGTRVEVGQENCPKCNGSDIQGVSRVTGYMSLDERFGKGKVAEREDRVKHAHV